MPGVRVSSVSGLFPADAAGWGLGVFGLVAGGVSKMFLLCGWWGPLGCRS